MPGQYTRKVDIICSVCDEHFEFMKQFANHVQRVHKMRLEDYTLRHFYDGVRPTCQTCGAETRYVSMMFKSHCKDHHADASARGGRIGAVAKKNKKNTLKLRVVAHNVGEPENIMSAATILHSKHFSSDECNIDIVTFVRDELGIDCTINTTDVIQPFEVTIWCPEKRIGIEHCSLDNLTSTNFNKSRHLAKYDLAKAADVRLLQFFGDEWRDSPDICKSVIRNALGKCAMKLNARDCSVVELSAKEAEEFLEASHIDGYTRASVKLGLVHPVHGLIQVVTGRTPIQKKHGNLLELARMAAKRDTLVRGGASKLLKKLEEVAQERGFEGLLSYAELRFGTGGVYAACGFERLADAKGNYWYTDGEVRFNRFKYRAQDGMTEKEYAEKNGVRQVFGVGNAVYVKRF